MRRAFESLANFLISPLWNETRDRSEVKMIKSKMPIIGKAFIVLLSLSLFATGAAAQNTQYNVTLSTDDGFDWKVTGYIEFTMDNPYGSATIKTSNGDITVNPGDRVKIIVNATSSGGGVIWFGSSGWADIRSLHVDAIYVNGELVAGDTAITDTSNLHYDVNSVDSTLRVLATLKPGVDYDWAQLTVDGETLIDAWNYTGYVIVYNVAPSSSQDLNLDISGKYLNAVAEGVEFTTDGVVNVIGVDELPFLTPVFNSIQNLLS